MRIKACNSIAIVWAMQVERDIKGRWTSARKLWSERISCKGQLRHQRVAFAEVERRGGLGKQGNGALLQ